MLKWLKKLFGPRTLVWTPQSVNFEDRRAIREPRLPEGTMTLLRDEDVEDFALHIASRVSDYTGRPLAMGYDRETNTVFIRDGA